MAVGAICGHEAAQDQSHIDALVYVEILSFSVPLFAMRLLLDEIAADMLKVLFVQTLGSVQSPTSYPASAGVMAQNCRPITKLGFTTCPTAHTAVQL